MLRARNQARRSFGQMSESKRRNLWNHRVPPEPWRWARVESEGWDKPLHRRTNEPERAVWPERPAAAETPGPTAPRPADRSAATPRRPAGPIRSTERPAETRPERQTKLAENLPHEEKEPGQPGSFLP